MMYCFSTYEHMSDDLSATITRIAQFCNIPIDESLLNLTLERASFAFMQHHKLNSTMLFYVQKPRSQCCLMAATVPR